MNSMMLDVVRRGRATRALQLGRIDFAGKTGKARHKVFQLLERTVSEPQLQLNRSYRFVDMTTRKHYPGQHQLHLIINGQIYCSAPFELQPAQSS